MDFVRFRFDPLPRDLADYAPRLMDLSWNRSADHAFTPMNPVDESPLPESTAVDGYQIRLLSTDVDPAPPTAIRLTIRAGQDNCPGNNACVVVFPPVGEFKSTAFQRRLLATLLKHWPVDSGSSSSHAFSEAVYMSDPDLYKKREERVPFEIGWLTYVRREGIAAALPAGTRVEPFGEPPGTLITLDGDQFEPENPAQIEQALRIREALRAADLLRDPAITPWSQIDRSIRPLRERRRRE